MGYGNMRMQHSKQHSIASAVCSFYKLKQIESYLMSLWESEVFLDLPYCQLRMPMRINWIENFARTKDGNRVTIFT